MYYTFCHTSQQQTQVYCSWLPSAPTAAFWWLWARTSSFASRSSSGTLLNWLPRKPSTSSTSAPPPLLPRPPRPVVGRVGPPTSRVHSSRSRFRSSPCWRFVFLRLRSLAWCRVDGKTFVFGESARGTCPVVRCCWTSMPGMYSLLPVCLSFFSYVVCDLDSRLFRLLYLQYNMCFEISLCLSCVVLSSTEVLPFRTSPFIVTQVKLLFYAWLPGLI